MSAVLNIEENALRAEWRDCVIPLSADFTLESGERLSQPKIAVRLYGDATKPVIAVAGGISAGRIVADAGDEKGWWSDYVAEGRAIDLRNYCVLGFDFLPNPEEQAITISTSDQARALGAALDALEFATLDAIIGSSYGGMVALAFAEAFPDRIKSLVIISAADKPHPFGTGLRGVQRRIVEFARENGDAEAGVALARQLAMVTYRSAAEFEARFEHAPGNAAGDPYAVCDYLISRGNAFQMAAQRFITLSDSIDRHAVDLTKIKARTLFIAAQGDQLSPPKDVRRCANAVPRARYVEIVSQYGHDAFLKEAASIGPFIDRFLKESVT